MPDGVEFRIAEAGSGTTRATGQIPLHSARAVAVSG